MDANASRAKNTVTVRGFSRRTVFGVNGAIIHPSGSAGLLIRISRAHNPNQPMNDLRTVSPRSCHVREGNGALLESCVLSELAKEANWPGEVEGIYFYRDKDKTEVDFVIEYLSGDIVGVEVKSSASVTGKDFTGLRKLASLSGKQFKLGVVLYDGEHVAPFGDRMFAAPIAAVWS